MRLTIHLALLAIALGPAVDLASAQTPDTTRRQETGLITGIAHDSINGGPLVGAIVQLASTGAGSMFVRTDTSDELGRFRFEKVPLGEYLLGFFHPMTDSLGIEVLPDTVYVVLPQAMRADVAIPSGAVLGAAACGPAATRDGDAATVLGVVRDADSRQPLAGAGVVVEWLEFSVGPAGFTQRRRRSTATTAVDGRYALCDVPKGTRIALWASKGADDTDILEFDLPKGGFLRNDLYLGAPQSGTGRLTGVVTASTGGRPLAGARVRIGEGTEVRANDRGEFALAGAPLGTRMIEVRAVGFQPTRRAVNVASNEPAVRVELPTLEAMLDTVRVTASRLATDRTGFAQRSRTGHGHYVSPEDIAKRNAIRTSDLFHTIPGVRVAQSGSDAQLTMRGTTGSCVPMVYLDGHRMEGLSAGDIDSFVRPETIKGIEVYSGSTAPPQFHPGMSGCGSIVIWTR